MKTKKNAPLSDDDILKKNKLQTWIAYVDNEINEVEFEKGDGIILFSDDVVKVLKRYERDYNDKNLDYYQSGVETERQRILELIDEMFGGMRFEEYSRKSIEIAIKEIKQKIKGDVK